MNSSSRPTRLHYPAAVAALLSAFALAPLSQPLLAQTVAVAGFDDGGWNADDVRDSGGTNITNDTSHHPGSGASSDSDGVAAQLQWVNNYKTFGNLGGLRIDPTAASGGKATISTINEAPAGFGVLGAVANAPGFGIAYNWSRDNNITPGISFRMGVQTASFADAQDAYTATRSGESGWDLVLAYDPTNNGNTTTSPGARPSVSAIDLNTGKFNLFSQANNAYWSTTAGVEEATKLGVGLEKSRTLAEWLADDYWGPILAAANIVNTQFGMGSGNQGGLATLDWAQISYLNDGDAIKFVADGTGRYTGDGADSTVFADAANWDGVTPDATTNLVIENGANLTVTGAQSARSLGGLGGVTNLTLAPGAVLTLNPAQNGTLSAFAGATVNVGGSGTLAAGTIESAGRVNIAVTATLDGGADPHPVRDGGPTATSRYAMIVAGGGEITLQNGAAITINQTGKNVGVRVGEGAGTGTLNIEPGAALEIGAENNRGFLSVGDFGGVGVVNQTGGTVSLVGAANIGAQGGTGTYNLSGGTVNVGLLDEPTDSNGFSVGARRTGTNAAPTGTLNISGTGELILTRGYLLVGGDTTPTSGGTGVVNQTGGLVRIIKDKLALGSGAAGTASGTYNLFGGVLELGGANGIQGGGSGGGSYAFNLGGGTLRVYGSNLTSSIAMNVVDINPNEGTGFENVSTSIIDTNGFNATLSGPLTGAGYLVKTGEGELTLSGSNNLTGEFYVAGGGLRQNAGVSTIHYIAVGSGAAKTGAFTMEGGSLDITKDLQVGDYSGTGTLNQTGGAITVGAASPGSLNIGNQGGNGTYNLSGGSFTITNGFANLGRSTQPEVAGDGVLNLSGTGLFHVGDGGDLIIGDRDAAGLDGNGTVNQTGGTLRVTGTGQLWIGSHGNGTYNLDGGALEIGGSQTLLGGYQSGVSGAFNLGGGTIRVIGSDLGTDLRPTLVAATISTIDTNGFNATFNNGLGGSGGFAKTGVGALTLNGTTDLQAASTVNGLLRIGAGSAKNGMLNLSSDLAVNAVDGVSRLQIGVDGGTGVANFTTGASFTITAQPGQYGTLDIGRGAGSHGTLNHSAGLVDIGGGALQVGYESAAGIYSMTDSARTELSTGSTTYIGDGAGGNGLLEISDAAQFIQGSQAVPGSQLFLGTDGGTGRLHQTGENSIVSIVTSNPVHIGYTFAGKAAGANGTYQLDAGTLTMGSTGGNGVRIGESADATGSFIQNGGTSSFILNKVYVGQGGNGVFTLNNGTSTVHAGLVLAQAAGSTGTLNLNGGTLAIGGANGIAKGAGAASFNLAGGTIKVTGSDLTTNVAPTLAAATTSTIDTGALNASFTGGLSGAGDLVKTGEGQLTVGAATSTGAFTLAAGTAEFTGASLGFQTLTVQAGAILAGTGNLALAADSVLTIEVGGVSDFGTVSVGGTFDAANATLNVVFVNGYTPAHGTTFDLFNFTSFGGSFAQVNILSAVGHVWDTSQLLNDGTISLHAIPEPATFAVLVGLGVLASAGLRRHRRAG